MAESPTRFIGLDIHKEYFVAIGVNTQREIVFGPRRVSVYQLEDWILRHLTGEDTVVLEMTTNTYLFYDTLLPHVHSVLVVHPPHVALVTKVSVKTDKKAALALAQLHAAGLLEGVWIPPHPVRDLRALLAQREKMVRLSTMATSSRCPSGRTDCTPYCTAITLFCQTNLFLPNNANGGTIWLSLRRSRSW